MLAIAENREEPIFFPCIVTLAEPLTQTLEDIDELSSV
jgi:hypothetical protein